MTARTLMNLLSKLPDEELELPVQVELGCGSEDIVALSSSSFTLGARPRFAVLLLMPGVEMPAYRNLPGVLCTQDHAWWQGLRNWQLRINHAPRHDVLALMDGIYGRPAGWEALAIEELRRCAIIQATQRWLSAALPADDG